MFSDLVRAAWNRYPAEIQRIVDATLLYQLMSLAAKHQRVNAGSRDRGVKDF